MTKLERTLIVTTLLLQIVIVLGLIRLSIDSDTDRQRIHLETLGAIAQRCAR